MDSERAAVRPVAADRRALADVGRQARLDLTFGRRGGRTVLLQAYSEPPFRVGRLLPDGEGIHLIMASSAPGVFGGDGLRQTIVVKDGARVRLTSQSAMQVHANETGALATFASSYHVESGGHLECAWDPVIPFSGARFRQRIEIEVADGASLLWSDALMAGREASGERWRFAELSHELRISCAGSLSYLERYRLLPDEMLPTGQWVADAACYFGTVVVIGHSAGRDLASSVHQSLSTNGEFRASADFLDNRLMLARLVSSDAVAFHRARASCRSTLGSRAADPHFFFTSR